MQQNYLLKFSLNLLLLITISKAHRQCTYIALKGSSYSEELDKFTGEIECCNDYACGGFSETQLLDSNWFNNPVYKSDKLYMLKKISKETFSGPINNSVKFSIPGGLRVGKDFYMRLTTLDGILSSNAVINLRCTNGNIPLHLNLRRITGDLVIDSSNGTWQSSIVRGGVLNFGVGCSIEAAIKTNSSGFSIELNYGTSHRDYMGHRFSPNCGTVLEIDGLVEINLLQFTDNNSY